MKTKIIMLASIFLLAILTLGIASAEDNATSDTLSDDEISPLQIEPESGISPETSENVALSEPAQENKSDWDIDFYIIHGGSVLGDELSSKSINDHELNEFEIKIINVPEGLKGNYSLYFNGKPYYQSACEDGDELFLSTYIDIGVHNFTVTYSGDDCFNPANKTKIITIKELTVNIPTEICPDDDEIIIIRDYYVVGNLKIYINGKVFKEFEFKKDDYESRYFCSLSKLKQGKTYNVEAVFTGDYFNQTDKATVTVTDKIKYYVEFDGGYEYTYGANNYYYIYAPRIDLDIRIDGKNTTCKYKNGKYKIDISDLDIGLHTLSASYSGDDNYIENTFYRAFRVIGKEDYNYWLDQYELAYFTYSLPDDAQGNLTFELKKSGEQYQIYQIQEVKDGKVNITLPTEHVGFYTFRTSFEGNYKLKIKGGLEIRPLARYDYPYYVNLDEETYFTLELPSDGIGNLSLEIKRPDEEDFQFYQSQEATDCEAKIILPTDNIGRYCIKPHFEGNYEIFEDIIEYKVMPLYYIQMLPFEIDYGLSQNVSLKLPSNGTGTITLKVNNADNSQTFYRSAELVDGYASIDFPTNKTGEFNYTVTYIGNYQIFNETDSVIIIPALHYSNGTYSLITDNQTNGHLYIAEYKDFDEHPLGEVDIINGKGEVNVEIDVTNEEDEIEIHAFFTSSEGKEIFLYDGIKIVTFKSEDITTYYGNRAAFKVKLINGSEALSRKALSVEIGSEKYPITTDENGIAVLKLPKLKPGTYAIKTRYKEFYVMNTLTVKHILTLKKVNVKKSAKKLTLQASLVKKLKGKTVTFKFNGKTYKAKTNKKGIAKVTIKQSALKKLKAGQKLTYSATYLKDTVKKTVKVQK